MLEILGITFIVFILFIALTSFVALTYCLFDLLYSKAGGTKGLAEVPFTSPISGKVRTAKRSRQDHIV
jgi:hypothetical protein